MKKLILIGLIAGLGISLSAESFIIRDRAEVVRSKPIYRNVVKRVPYQECWNEQVPVNDYYDDGGNTIDNNFGALIGGVAGGILGHQLGGGSGKTAATVGGAIIGTLVGKNLSHTNHRRRYTSGYTTKRKCVTKYSETRDTVITRYKNIAYYQGRKIVKFSNKPLRYISIRKIIEY